MYTVKSEMLMAFLFPVWLFGKYVVVFLCRLIKCNLWYNCSDCDSLLRNQWLNWISSAHELLDCYTRLNSIRSTSIYIIVLPVRRDIVGLVIQLGVKKTHIHYSGTLNMRDMKGYLLAPGTLLPYLGQLLTSIYILEYSSEYLNEYSSTR